MYTDSFINAEVAYRGERIHQAWGTRPRRARRTPRAAR
jgi:hypothetical protein